MKDVVPSGLRRDATSLFHSPKSNVVASTVTPSIMMGIEGILRLQLQQLGWYQLCPHLAPTTLTFSEHLSSTAHDQIHTRLDLLFAMPRRRMQLFFSQLWLQRPGRPIRKRQFLERGER